MGRRGAGLGKDFGKTGRRGWPLSGGGQGSGDIGQTAGIHRRVPGSKGRDEGPDMGIARPVGIDRVDGMRRDVQGRAARQGQPGAAKGRIVMAGQRRGLGPVGADPVGGGEGGLPWPGPDAGDLGTGVEHKAPRPGGQRPSASRLSRYKSA